VSVDSEVSGETKIRNHCTFRWRQSLAQPEMPRVYEIRPHHCEQCIVELRRLNNTVEDWRARLAGE
jgi:hypothetical protein